MTQQSQNPQPPNYGAPPPNQPPPYGQQPYQQPGPGYQQPGYPQPGQGYPQPGYQQPGYYPPVQPVQPARKGFPVWAIFLIAIPIVVVGGCLILSFIVSSLASHAIDSAATAVSDGSSTIGAISSGGGTVGAATQVTPIKLDLPATPVRGFSYAGLKITVKKAEISNQVLDNPPRYRADTAHIDLTLTFTNPTARGINISSGLLQITLGDGSVYKKPFDFGVNQQDTQDQTYTFDVPPTATWSKAQLSLSQVNKEPVTIPLDAPVPAATYPITLAATGVLNLKNPNVDYTLKNAKLDLDSSGQRAPTGQRYLILTITILSHEPDSAYISDDNFRLIVDGTAQAPDTTDIPLGTGRLDQTEDATIVFLIPNSTQAATLQLGEKSQIATIPINLAK